MKSSKEFIFLIWFSFILSSIFVELATASWVEVGGSNSMTGTVNSSAGSSVAMTPDGNTVVVGQPGWNISSGRIGIYSFTGEKWFQITNTTVMYGDIGDRVGSSVAISSDGAMVAVGEPGWNSNSGRVRTFSLSGTTWIETGGALSMIGQTANQSAGYSVAMSSDGKTVVVGEPSSIGSSMDGLVRVYNLTGGIWTEIGDFIGTAGSFSNPNLFGFAVDISSNGDTIVIGAPGTSSSQGQVVVYNLSGSSWVQLGNFSDMNGENSGDQAGSAVAINSDGTIVAVGEPSWNYSTGRVRVYSLSGNSWIEIGDSHDMAGKNQGDAAGNSVAISADGTIVAVGEPFWLGSSQSSNGRVRVYKFLAGSWQEIGNINDMAGKNYGDEAGYSVAISPDGRTVAVGEPGWGGESFFGRARVYVLKSNSNINEQLSKITHFDISRPTTPGNKSNHSAPGQGVPFAYKPNLGQYIITKGQ